jgi:hypothetical protein
VPKDASDVVRRMRGKLTLNLAVQGVFALVLLGAAAATTDAPRVARLYLWAIVIPLGFGVVFALAYRRGARIRMQRLWTLQWERADVRRAYQGMAAVMVLWAVGLLVLLFVL